MRPASPKRSTESARRPTVVVTGFAGVRVNQLLIHQYAFPAPLRGDASNPRGFEVNRFENSQRGSGSTRP